MIWAPFLHLSANIVKVRYGLTDGFAAAQAAILLSGALILYPVVSSDLVLLLSVVSCSYTYTYVKMISLTRYKNRNEPPAHMSDRHYHGPSIPIHATHHIPPSPPLVAPYTRVLFIPRPSPFSHPHPNAWFDPLYHRTWHVDATPSHPRPALPSSPACSTRTRPAQEHGNGEFGAESDVSRGVVGPRPC